MRFAPNDRGNLVRAVGDRIEVYDTNPNLVDPDSQPVLYFTVNAINIDASCPAQTAEVVGPSMNGQFVSLDMTVETTADFTDTTYTVNPGSGWELVTAAGESLRVETYPSASCGNYPFSTLRPDRAYNGSIFLDVPTDIDGAVLVLNTSAGGGWEFAL